MASSSSAEGTPSSSFASALHEKRGVHNPPVVGHDNDWPRLVAESNAPSLSINSSPRQKRLINALHEMTHSTVFSGKTEAKRTALILPNTCTVMGKQMQDGVDPQTYTLSKSGSLLNTLHRIWCPCFWADL